MCLEGVRRRELVGAILGIVLLWYGTVAFVVLNIFEDNYDRVFIYDGCLGKGSVTIFIFCLLEVIVGAWFIRKYLLPLLFNPVWTTFDSLKQQKLIGFIAQIVVRTACAAQLVTIMFGGWGPQLTLETGLFAKHNAREAYNKLLDTKVPTSCKDDGMDHLDVAAMRSYVGWLVASSLRHPGCGPCQPAGGTHWQLHGPAFPRQHWLLIYTWCIIELHSEKLCGDVSFHCSKVPHTGQMDGSFHCGCYNHTPDSLHGVPIGIPRIPLPSYRHRDDSDLHCCHCVPELRGRPVDFCETIDCTSCSQEGDTSARDRERSELGHPDPFARPCLSRCGHQPLLHCTTARLTSLRARVTSGVCPL